MPVSACNSSRQSATPFESHSWPRVTPASYWLSETTTTTVTKSGTGLFSGFAGGKPYSPESQAFSAQLPVTKDQQFSVVPADAQPLHYSQSLPAAHQQSKRAGSLGPSSSPISGFFSGGAQENLLNKTSMAVFGADYVADVMETFYIREKPVVSQPGDGVIRIPGSAPMQFMDGFKVDVSSGIAEQRVLRDLPSREVICCQRRKKAAISATIMICAGSVADDRNLVAYVRKTGDRKATLELEKRGQVQYSIEGDLVQRNYNVMKNGTQVAQVTRNEDARAAVTSKHSYCLQVAPQTDCALMIAAAMAVEDIFHVK